MAPLECGGLGPLQGGCHRREGDWEERFFAEEEEEEEEEEMTVAMAAVRVE